MKQSASKAAASGLIWITGSILLLSGLFLAAPAFGAVALEKTGPAEAEAAEQFDFVITVINSGADSVSGLTLFDRLPEGLELISAPGCTTVDDSDSEEDGSLACSVTTLDEDEEQVFTIRVRVAAVNEPGSVTNEVRLRDSGGVLVASDSHTVDLIPVADLVLQSRVGPADPVAADDSFSYTLQMTNLGPSRASGLVLTDTVPNGAVPTGFSGDGWSCDFNQVRGDLRCARATLDAGSSSSLTFTVRAPRNPPDPGQPSGVISSGNALLSSATRDPDTDNNTITDALEVTINALASLSVSKRAFLAGSNDDAALFVPTQAVNYRITLRNTGPSDLIGDLRPTLDDVFDASLRGTIGFCASPATEPCWSCQWRLRPQFQQLVTTASGDSLTGLGGAQALALTPDGERVIVAGGLDDALALFNRRRVRDDDFGDLSYGSSSELVQAAAVAVHPGGRWVVAASADGLALSVFERVGNSLNPASTLSNELGETGKLVFSADGRFLYATDGGQNRIRVFGLDGSSGSLSLTQTVSSSALAGITDLVISPDQRFVYVVSPDGRSLIRYARDLNTGELSGAVSTPVQVGDQPLSVVALAVSVDGEELYVGGANAVVTYRRDVATGEVSQPNAIVASSMAGRLLQGVVGLVSGDDADSLYVLAAEDRTVSLLQRGSGGRLEFRRSSVLPGQLQPNSAALDPAGQQLYVTARDAEQDESAVVTFRLTEPGGCGALRAEDLGSGDIDQLPIRLPSGQSVVLTVFASVIATPQATEVSNTATLTDALPPQAAFSDSVTVPIRNATEIRVTKTALDEREPVPGSLYAYRVRVENTGPSSVNDVRLTDILPVFSAGATAAGFVAGSSEWSCSATANACCNPGGGQAACGTLSPTPFVSGNLQNKSISVGVESSVTFILRGRVHPASPPLSELNNQAQISLPAGIEPFRVEDLTASHVATVDPQVDLWVLKRADQVRRSPTSGGADAVSLEYSLSVGNDGPSAVSGVRLIDTLSDEAFDADGALWSCEVLEAGESSLAPTCCAFSAGACAADSLADQVGAIDQAMALAPGARLLFRLVVPVQDAGAETVVNEASFGLPFGITNTQTRSNRARLTTRLRATADLDISKEILAGDEVTPGEQVNFSITVTNAGPDGVPVVVRDLFPPELGDVLWTCDATTPIPGDLAYSALQPAGTELVRSSSVINSIDGRHVYVIGAGGAIVEGDDPLPASVAVYARNILPGPAFGSLSLIEIETDGQADDSDGGLAVEGLAGARSGVLSPDQRHLYIASETANAVVVFSRNVVPASEDFGRLTFVEARFNGSDEPSDAVPVSGLRGAADVRVSHDGQHVYVASAADHAVAIFRRDPGTGKLSFEGRYDAEQLAIDEGGVFGLWGALSIHIAPNDRDVYVSGRGPTAGLSGRDWSVTDTAAAVGDLAYFVPNTAGIDLKWIEMQRPLTIGASAELVLEFQHRYQFDSPGSCWDVGVLEVSLDGGASWVDAETGGLGFFVSGGYNGQQNGAENNPLDQRRGWCGTSPGFAAGAFVSVRYEFNPGAVSSGDQLSFRWGLGEGDIVGGPGWWLDDIRITDGGGLGSVLFEDAVVDTEDGATIIHLRRDDDLGSVGFGRLSFVDKPDLPDNTDISAALLDDEAQNLYVASASGSGRILVYSRNLSSGLLNRIAMLDLQAIDDDPDQTLPEDIEPDALAGISALAISRDGEHLLAAGPINDRLVVLRRQPFVGTLVPIQMLQPDAPPDNRVEFGIRNVRGMGFSADGQHAFTVTGNGQFAQFDRLAPDPTFGFLEAVIEGVDDGFGTLASGLLGARSSALSANGRWLFVAAYGQIGVTQTQRGSLVVLERDPASVRSGGHLRFRQALRHQQGGVAGLDGAIDVLALDNRDIYVVAERSEAVTHFRQDPVSGVVSFVTSYGRADNPGLGGATAITSSADGEFLFLAGRFSAAVAVFQRNFETGELTYLGAARDGQEGVTGLRGPSALVMSNDDAHLYVAGRESNAVVVFRHDRGNLTHLQTFFDGNEGAVIRAPTGLAMSAETGGGEHVLVTSLDGNAVTVLRRQTDPSIPQLLGRVRFQQSLVNGVGGVTALRGPRGIAVDPDNDRVYVVSELDDALVVFDRNTSASSPQFGSLTPLEVRRQGVGGVLGIGRPYGVTLSSGARRNIYTAALGSQSVAAFVRRSGSSCPAAGGGDLNEEVFVAANGTVRFMITATVAPGGLGDLVNTAELVIPPEVTNTGSRISDSTPPRSLVPRSNLRLSKSNNRLSVVAGSRERYRIVLTNEGPSHAREVDLSDLLSGNPQFDAASAVWTCQAVGSGLLERAETIQSDDSALAGLAGAAGLSWAPSPGDGLPERVYATGVLGNALSVFEPDPLSGRWQVVEVLADGSSDQFGNVIEGLRGARGVAVSADGASVYVTSQIENRLFVFDVESDPDSAAFGRLRLRQSLGANLADLSGMNQPLDIAVSGDGQNVFVAAALSGRIYVFNRAPSGQLSFNSWVGGNGLAGVSALALGPEGRHVYAAGTGDSAVVVLRRTASNGLAIEQVRTAAGQAGLVGISAVAVSSDGGQVYTVSRDDNSIVVFGRDNNDVAGNAQFGRLLSGSIQRISRSEVPGLVSPRAIVVTGNGNLDAGGNVYVAAFESSSVLAFRRDGNNGRLSFLARYADAGELSGLAGVASLALTGDNSELFAGALIEGAVTRFSRTGFSRCGVDSGTGDVLLSLDVAAGGSVLIDLDVNIAAQTTGQACIDGLDPTRNCVVNTARFEHLQAGVPVSGEARDVSFLDRAANLSIAKTDGLAEFRGLAAGAAIAGTSQFGSHVYVAAPGEPGIGVYSTEPLMGAPTGSYPVSFVQAVRNGLDGVSLLNGIADVVVSPDGLHVYASSQLDNAVVAFRREPGSGRLSILAAYANNTDGISGLSGARGIALSPDGEHLYVAGRNANAVSIFRRITDESSAQFGSLQFKGRVQQGSGGVESMLAPVDVLVSPDGAHLYVASEGSSAVVVFDRDRTVADQSFGSLSFRQARRNLVGGVAGLLNPSALEMSSDGAHLYVAGTGNSAIARFTRSTNPSSAAFGELAFAGVIAAEPDNLPSLTGVRGLVLFGAAEQWLAAMAPGVASVTLFERSPGNGALALANVIADGEAQDQVGLPPVVANLQGVRAGFALPGSDRLFAVARDASSLAVFEREDAGLVFAGSVVQGGGGAVPGQTVEYLITVRNDGPSRVVGARVTDIFPPEFESVLWRCEITQGVGSCPTGGPEPDGRFSGNISALVTLDVGAVVTFFAEGVLRPDITNRVVNTATVTLPAGIVDLDPTSNSATDGDTVSAPRSDLSVRFQGVPDVVYAGAELQLQLVVANAGPSAAVDASLSLELPEALILEDWICLADREPGRLALQEPPTGGLSAFRAAVVTESGRHLYAVGEGPTRSAILVFERNPLNGRLTPIQQLTNLDVQDLPGGGVMVDGLQGASALVLSPDQRHLYVAGREDDAIAVFVRDELSGELRFAQVVRDEIGAVSGLGGVADLAISGDGAQLYAVGELDNAIVTLNRSADTGRLSFAQVLRNNQSGVRHLQAPLSLVLTDADGKVLVAAPDANAVVRFGRDAGGLLSFQGAFVDGAEQRNGTELIVLEGLAGVRSLAVSADGTTLYTVARRGSDHAFGVFARPSANLLRPLQILRDGDEIGVPPVALDGLAEADSLLLGAADEAVYLGGFDSTRDQRTVTALRIVGPGDLQLLGRFDGGPAEGGAEHRLAISTDGRHLYGAAEAAELDHYRIQLGSLCGREGRRLLLDRVDLEAGGQVVYDLTGRVLANARGSFTTVAQVEPQRFEQDLLRDNNRAVLSQAITPAAGLRVIKTHETSPVVAGEPITWRLELINDGPSDIRFTEIDDLLPALPGNPARPNAAGVLAGSSSWQCTDTRPLTLNQSISELQASAASVSADGLWAAAADGASATLVLYARHPESGWLSPVAVLVDGQAVVDADGEQIGTVSGIAGASDLVFGPDSRDLYLASTQDRITRFRIEPANSGLVFDSVRRQSDNDVEGLRGPIRLVFSPDGRQLVVAAEQSNAVTIFDRDPLSGLLVWRQTHRSGLAGLPVNALDGLRDLVFSPDGRNLYAAASAHNSIALFERSASGTYTYLSSLRRGDPQGGVQVVGLNLVQSLAISPQGTQLYASSLAEDSVTVFSRDPDDRGSLQWQRQFRTGFSGVSGLDGPRSLRLSPDGRRLIVAAENDANLVVFERDWFDGALRQLYRYRGAEIAGARRLLFAPDGGRLLVFGQAAGGLIVLGVQADSWCGLDRLNADRLTDTVDLTAGGRVVYEVTSLVHPGARGLLVNEATAILPPGVISLSELTETGRDEVEIQVRTDLSIEKSLLGESSALLAGNPLGYELRVGNAGPSHAFDARVLDLFPPAILDVAWSCRTLPNPSLGSACPELGAGDIDALVDVLVGEALDWAIQGRIAPDYIGALVNVAEVQAPADGTDLNLENNLDSALASVTASADVRLSKTALIDEAAAGEVVPFRILIDNAGPSTAPAVRIFDQVPSGMSILTWTCDAVGGGSCPMSSGSGALDVTASMPPESRLSFELQALIDPGLPISTVLTNFAEAELVGTQISDPQPSNNRDSASVRVSAILADLGASKLVSMTEAEPGDLLGYDIVVGNSGPSTASEVRIFDPVPVGLDDMSWTCSGTGGAVCPVAAGTGDIDLVLAMPVDSEIRIEVEGRVSGVTSSIVNRVTANVTGAGVDPDEDRAVAVAVTQVNLELDVIFRDSFIHVPPPQTQSGDIE